MFHLLIDIPTLTERAVVGLVDNLAQKTLTSEPTPAKNSKFVEFKTLACGVVSYNEVSLAENDPWVVVIQYWIQLYSSARQAHGFST